LAIALATAGASLLAPPMVGGSSRALTAPTGALTAVRAFQTTADGTERLQRQPTLVFLLKAPSGLPVVDVNDQVSYQRVDGFGATMTDTSAWLLEDELPASTTLATIRSLFGGAGSGIGINFLRVPMGASDFTRNETPYSYDDLPPGQQDPKLTHFSVAHDVPYIIPSLRQALSLNPHLEILANPWSPPAWMKTNGSLNNHNHGGRLRRSAYGPLALYFVKFVLAYASLGVPVSDVTSQNEPGNGTLYPGLQISARQETRLIHSYLAPALRAARLSTHIYAGDGALSSELVSGTRDLRGFVKQIVESPAGGDVSGIAWHCYFGNPSVISAVHDLAPSLRQIGDECAPGDNPLPMPDVLISELRNWASVVSFFNVAEDPQGGPVQPPNHGCGGCTPLVIVDENAHVASLHLNYYVLGQASAFVKPGAYRIDSNHFVSYQFVYHHPPQVSAGLDDVAFRNPDGSKVLLAYNTSASPREFAVHWRDSWFTYTLPAGATVTFLWTDPPGVRR
jgi:glucosylceramidase